MRDGRGLIVLVCVAGVVALVALALVAGGRDPFAAPKRGRR